MIGRKRMKGGKRCTNEEINDEKKNEIVNKKLLDHSQ